MVSEQFNLLKNRNFAILWTAQTFSGLGDGIFRVAQIVLLLKIDASATALSSLLFIMVLPGIILSLFGGVFADRYNRRLILIIANVLRGLAMAVLVIILYREVLELWHLYALAFLYGGVGAFSNPAFDSMIPEIVEKKHIQTANSLFLLGDNISSIAGPAIGGLIITISNASSAVIINSLSFFILVYGLSIIKTQPTKRMLAERSIIHNIIETVSFAYKNKMLISFLVLFAAVNISATLLTVSLPLYVTQTLHKEAGLYGIYLSGMNIGLLLGVLYMSVLKNFHRGRMVIISVLMSAILGYLLLGFTRQVWIGVLAVTLIDGLTMIGNIIFPAWIQTAIPDEQRGRAFGLTSVVSYSLVPLGFVMAAILGSYVGPGTTIIVAGLLLVIVAVASFIYSPLRNLK